MLLKIESLGVKLPKVNQLKRRAADVSAKKLRQIQLNLGNDLVEVSGKKNSVSKLGSEKKTYSPPCGSNPYDAITVGMFC